MLHHADPRDAYAAALRLATEHARAAQPRPCGERTPDGRELVGECGLYLPIDECPCLAGGTDAGAMVGSGVVKV